MSNVVRMVQGSAEWHEHRRKYRNASETPVVLGLSPWTTPYQLWQVKLGLIEQEVNPAMQRGTELEPVARAAYERQTGRVMQPLVVVDGEYSASLDGMTLGGERIVEIKCPVKGKESTLWKMVEMGQLPEHYQCQVQHQLLVTGAAVADVYAFDGSEGILLEVTPAPETWPRIHDAWDKFAVFLASKTPPPLSKGDVRERSDTEWTTAAAYYIETKLFVEQAQKALSESKDRLVALASHTSETGGGVTVTRYWKRAAIEYTKIPEIKALDLESYRGPAREEVRVTTM
jgi:putative phage-type endonuclease